MPRNINSVELQGHLGRDAECVVLPSGNWVCKMSLATTDSRKNKQTGKWENGDTHWHSISLFGDAVRTARELKKGDCVNVKGKVTYSKKDDKYYTNIVCFKCERITSDQNNQTNVAPNKPANDGGDIPF